MADDSDISQAKRLAESLSRLYYWISAPANIHRRTIMCRDFSLASYEELHILPPDRPYFAPALRAIASYRWIHSFATNEAEFAFESTLPIDIKSKVSVALSMVVEAMTVYDDVFNWLFHLKLSPQERRLKTVKFLRRGLLNVSNSCGTNVLEAIALTELYVKSFRKVSDSASPELPEGIREELVDEVRWAIKTLGRDAKRGRIQVYCARNRQNVLMVLDYLKAKGEYDN